MTEYYNKFVQNDNNDQDVPDPVLFEDKRTRHIVHPAERQCTCGKWQDMNIPCRHAMAYFGKWNGFELDQVLKDHVHYYFRYKSMQTLYTPNICPVVTDTVEFDGKTRPPQEKNAPGRPKKKRFRRRSRFVDHQKSPIKCSICGNRGHNARTCTNKHKEAAAVIAVQENEHGSGNKDTATPATYSPSENTTNDFAPEQTNLKNDSDYD